MPAEGSLITDLEAGRPARLRRFDELEAEFAQRSVSDPERRATVDLLPPARLTLVPFVDGHAAGPHHSCCGLSGAIPSRDSLPTLADSAGAEQLVAAITAVPD